MKQEQASSTAKIVAAAMLLLDSYKQTKHLVAEDASAWCEVFLSASFSGRFLAASAKCPITRRLWLSLEKCTLPGIIRHYAYRKRWIERHCRASFALGYKHLVIIGAGFDALGVRMAHEFPELRVTEIDHPATQGEKLRGMTIHNKSQPGNIRFVPVDLETQKIPTSLFTAEEAPVFVIEGLLMYLAEERVCELLENLHTLPVASSRLIASYICRRPDGKIGFTPRSRLIDLWLHLREEPFRWSQTQEMMIRFMQSAGFSCLYHATGSEMADAHDAEPVLNGENFFLAENTAGR